MKASDKNGDLKGAKLPKNAKKPTPQIENNAKPKPEQPLPITIDNFFISTKGVFTQINEIPKGFTLFFKSKGSAYYTNDLRDTVVRQSDHWGRGIRYCAWHLKGHRKRSIGEWRQEHGKNMFIGIILIHDLKPNIAAEKLEPTNTQPAIKTKWMFE